MPEQPQIAYGIETIHDCIVKDTAIYREFKAKSKKIALYRKTKKLLDKHPEVKKMIDQKFVSSLDPERGKCIGKADWMPTELVITDQRIREMCRNMFSYPEEYVKATGLRFGPCPGFGRMSACPTFSPRPEEIREKLNNSDIFIGLQSKYFTSRPEITGWHEFLVRKLKKEIENVEGKGSVTLAFGAGPCQICHPKPCLGGGECRVPDKRLFALESVGIPVGQLCNDMALLTGNNGWKIGWMKYYGTSRQTRNRWKFTFGLAVRLNRKKKK
jgi:predicted metal-binding protein